MSERASVRRARNRTLARHLAAVGAAGHFSRYVVARRPDALSLAAFSRDEHLVGTAVCGAEHDLHESFACWLFDDSSDTFDALLQAVDPAWCLNFALERCDAVRETGREVAVDRLLALLPSRYAPPPRRTACELLTRRRLEELEIAPILQRSIGRPADLPEGFPLHGIVCDGVLVAMAEHAVRDATTVAIQNVRTLDSHRRRGLAASLVAELAEQVLAEGMTPTYFVSEDNVASLALAESLGFELHSRWGYADPAS